MSTAAYRSYYDSEDDDEYLESESDLDSLNDDDDDDVDDVDDEEEEEIARRVNEEMQAVMASLHRATPTAPSSSSSYYSNYNGRRNMPYDDSGTESEHDDDDDDYRSLHAVEDKVKRRAQELFEVMQQEQEELERKRVEDEIERRVMDEARRKAELLLKAEEADVLACQRAAEAERVQAEQARRAHQEATARRIEEEVARRVDHEARRIRDLLLARKEEAAMQDQQRRARTEPLQQQQYPLPQQSLPSPLQQHTRQMPLVPRRVAAPSERKGAVRKSYLAPIAEAPEEDEGTPAQMDFKKGSASEGGEPACDIWTPYKMMQRSALEDAGGDTPPVAFEPLSRQLSPSAEVGSAALAAKGYAEAMRSKLQAPAPVTAMASRQPLSLPPALPAPSHGVPSVETKEGGHDGDDDDYEHRNLQLHELQRLRGLLAMPAQQPMQAWAPATASRHPSGTPASPTDADDDVDFALAALTPDGEDKQPDAAPLPAPPAISSPAPALSVEQHIALEVERRIAERDAAAAAAVASVDRPSTAVHTPRRDNSTPATTTAMAAAALEVSPLTEAPTAIKPPRRPAPTPSTPRASAAGTDANPNPATKAPPPSEDRERGRPMAAPLAQDDRGAANARLLPSPRPKTFSATPDRLRAVAAQLAPLSAAQATGALLPVGLKRPLAPLPSQRSSAEPSEVDFMDATFSGQKYTGLELASHQIFYRVVGDDDNDDDGDDDDNGGTAGRQVRVVECCVVHKTSLKSQIREGDILVSVNDWPLINTPAECLDGGKPPTDAHFEAVLKLLRLAAPPRRIRFLRSADLWDAGQGSGTSAPLLRLSSDDALLLYDGLAVDDYEALTADVAAAEAAERLALMRAREAEEASKRPGGAAARTEDQGGKGGKGGQGGKGGKARATASSSEASTDDTVNLPRAQASGEAKAAAATTTTIRSASAPNDAALAAVGAKTTAPPPARVPAGSTSAPAPGRGHDDADMDGASALTAHTHPLAGPNGPHPQQPQPQHQQQQVQAQDGQPGPGSGPGGEAVPRKRVSGFFKAVGRALGLRKSAKDPVANGPMAPPAGFGHNGEPLSMQTYHQDQDGNFFPADVRQRSASGSSLAFAASVHFKTFSNPGALGIKLTYHNLMFADLFGQLLSVNCLVVGGFTSPDAASTPDMMREGDVIVGVNSSSALALRRPTPMSSPAEDVDAAQQFFAQAVQVIGQAASPRVLKCFRLADARTVTSGQVFTVLVPAEVAVLSPHLKYIPV